MSAWIAMMYDRPSRTSRELNPDVRCSSLLTVLLLPDFPSMRSMIRISTEGTVRSVQ